MGGGVEGRGAGIFTAARETLGATFYPNVKEASGFNTLISFRTIILTKMPR